MKLSKASVSRILGLKGYQATRAFEIVSQFVETFGCVLTVMDKEQYEKFVKNVIEQYKINAKIHIVQRSGVTLKELQKVLNKVKRMKVLEHWMEVEETDIQRMRQKNGHWKMEECFNVKIGYIL